jgi:4'-phosphopantetheinyl transferase
MVREILSGYLRDRPERITFEYGRYGKPRLASTHPRLHFNASHREGRGLVGVTTLSPIGVDIEHVTDDVVGREIARQYFCPEETERVFAAGQNAQIEFFKYWTCKEAYVKGVGGGLGISLVDFEVRPIDEHLCRGRIFAGPRRTPTGWYVHQIPVADGWLGAFAVEAASIRVRLRTR